MIDVVRSAARVLDLLEFFAEREGQLTLASLTQVFGMPKSSMFGLLRTLCARGYLLRDAQGAYQLNPYFREHGFGWGGDRIVRLSAIADPVMRALSDELGETISLGLLTDEGTIKVLKQALSSQPVRYEVNENHPVPAYCSAMGRILLAALSGEVREKMLGLQSFLPLTAFTVTEPRRIRDIIEHAAADGYCVVEDETDLGGTGVAACISAGNGRPIIALNVSCISARFEEKREAVIAAVVREASVLRSALAV